MDQVAEWAASDSFPNLATIHVEYESTREPEKAARLVGSIKRSLRNVGRKGEAEDGNTLALTSG
ncbi:hypothetical protein N7508_010040 [Penicillium antarcticum]|uniref:uncharacterized protein n=1 Tax=Penicillium antarcticum TaxID=416450 RepID=UPI0023919BE7|nr:uncharacterized protein N7508_010040 [Penicillium antarcticum]KAJ5295219.1 hypothetical protein N7508_010040 [Penicillium antarcticum]